MICYCGFIVTLKNYLFFAAPWEFDVEAAHLSMPSDLWIL